MYPSRNTVAIHATTTAAVFGSRRSVTSCEWGARTGPLEWFAAIGGTAGTYADIGGGGGDGSNAPSDTAGVTALPVDGGANGLASFIAVLTPHPDDPAADRPTHHLSMWLFGRRVRHLE
jgi:hypothetical protein